MNEPNDASSSGPASPAQPALSDSERLLLTCLQQIAKSEAAATRGMGERDTELHVNEAIFELIQSLGAVSASFADETERYLRQAIGRARSH